MALTRDLQIFEVQDIEPVAQKPGGTREGYIGVHHNDLYMVKIEGQGYNTTVIGYASELSAVESLTAQLIRSTWGQEYAADIHLGYIRENIFEINKHDLSSSSLKNNQLDGLTLLQEKYSLQVDDLELPLVCAVSKFENNSISFENWLKLNRQNLTTEQSRRLTEIQTIAKILGIDDYKFSNMIVSKNKIDQVKLIDCAATFYFNAEFQQENLFNPSYLKTNLGNNFDKEAVYPIIDKFVNLQPDKLDNLLSQYENVLTQDTRDQIKLYLCDLQANLQKTLMEEKNHMSDKESTLKTTLSTSYMLNSLNIHPSSNEQHPEHINLNEQPGQAALKEQTPILTSGVQNQQKEQNSQEENISSPRMERR